MKKIIIALCSGLIAASASATSALTFEDGKIAFEERQYQQAYDVWLKLAESGDHKAQNNLGGLYATGRGVIQDEQKALIWISRAAEQGDEKAIFNLSQMRKNQK